MACYLATDAPKHGKGPVVQWCLSHQQGMTSSPAVQGLGQADALPVRELQQASRDLVQAPGLVLRQIEATVKSLLAPFQVLNQVTELVKDEELLVPGFTRRMGDAKGLKTKWDALMERWASEKRKRTDEAPGKKKRQRSKGLYDCYSFWSQESAVACLKHKHCQSAVSVNQQVRGSGENSAR